MPKGGLTLNNFKEAFDKDTLKILGKSLLFALLTSVFCLLLAYPLALILSNKKFNRSAITVMLFVLPMWINFLLRTLAIKTIFDFMGIPNGYWPALIGTVYDFLPFMILPIYTTLCNIDNSLTEASADLGANSILTFLKVTLPLSVPGILSGTIMVFMPTVSSFAIPQYLGQKLILFGELIDNAFSKPGGSMRNIGSALSLIMLVLVGLSVFAANVFAKKQSGLTEVKSGKW